MKYLLAIIFLCVVVQPVWAATPNPNRQTMWNNLTDTVHTMGQTPQRAKLTKMKLHAQRRQTRLKNMAQANNRQRHKHWMNEKPQKNKSWMKRGT